MILRFKKLRPDAVVPVYKSPGAAAADLATPDFVCMEPRGHFLVKTGLAVEIPPGYEGQIRSRSGLALKGVTAFHGTIDSDFRGELGVLLFNNSDLWVSFYIGERIAQIVFSKYEKADFLEVAELDATDRGEGGFGSTGA